MKSLSRWLTRAQFRIHNAHHTLNGRRRESSQSFVGWEPCVARNGLKCKFPASLVMPCVQLILLCQLQCEQVRGFCVHGHAYLTSTSKCYAHLCHLSFLASPIFQHACFLICMSDIDTCCPFIADAKTEDWDGLK